MISCNRIAFVVALCATLAGAATRHLHLDAGYMVDVEIKNETGTQTLELTLTVNTTGWVGFGVNNVSTMANADLFIGGVDENGAKYHGDYLGLAENGGPLINDTKQDWRLLDAKEENGNTTILKVSRNLDTGDEEQDRKIEDANLFVLWSYGENDDVTKMHVNKGAKQLNLFTADDNAGDSGTALVSCFSTLVMGLIVSLYRN